MLLRRTPPHEKFLYSVRLTATLSRVRGGWCRILGCAPMGRSNLLGSYEADESFDPERQGHLTLLRAFG